MKRCSLAGALCLLLVAANVCAQDGWTLYPSTNTVRKVVKDYTPTFEKHFKVEDGVLKGTCGLGKAFYEEHKVKTFAGVGQIWATNAAWPTDASDFEFTCEYKWFQEEPMKKFGDFPDLNLGFRLSKAGKGCYIRWGFLGDIMINRMADGHDYVIARGLERGWKGRWVKVKLLCAGPVIKVKIWRADRPEPETWSAEAYDEQTDASGAVAVGFFGRKLFDTCVYEFKNAKLRVLTPPEAKAVRFFDAKTAPKDIGHPKTISTSIRRVKKPETIEPLKDLNAWQKDKNLLILPSAGGRLVFRSADGKPAFLRKEIRRFRSFFVRAQSSGEARPLVGVRILLEDAWAEAHINPIWRPGIAALVYENDKHTGSAHAFTWKTDTWYDFGVVASHWLKWFFHETDDDKAIAAFAAKMPGNWYRTKKQLLIGAQGTGTVTVKGVFVK